MSIFTDNAQTILCKRYFYKSDNGKLCSRCNVRHETEEEFIKRVSMGNQLYETKLIRPLKFLPNTPTLVNMDTPTGGTLSACFKFDIEDTMFDSPSGIMPTANKAAKVLKAGGGVGYVFSNLRPKGATVNSTHGKALGPIGVARILHVLAREITQGGVRDAAQMGIMHCEHPDIEQFIHWKDDDPDGMGTFNISVALTDEFMDKAINDPSSRESSLLKQMAQSAWKTGDPGCYFIDTAERSNPTPWAGQLTGTNPCGEVPLLNNEPCNLGSINLGKFYKNDNTTQIDWDDLKETVYLAIQYLDDVLDKNVFPDVDVDNAARYTRKLGLGVCGFADLLTLMGIPYDSEEALNFANDIMRFITTRASTQSRILATVKGVAPCFKDRDEYIRNATRTCIAPTGTIAILMDASSGIEPYFALEWERTMGDGTKFIERPWPLRDGNRPSPKIANEINWEWHVNMQAAFQKYTDLAVSKTINMANDVSWQDILDAYIYMWESGCKGGTIYRDGSRFNQVLKAEQEVPPAASDMRLQNPLQKATSAPTMPDKAWRDALPADSPALRHKFEVGQLEGYLHVGVYEDGSPGEMFVTVAREGSTIDGLLNMLAQSASLNFQMLHHQGKPFSLLTEKWRGRKFEPAGFTTNPEIPHAESLADYFAKWFDNRFAQGSVEVVAVPAGDHKLHGDACPDCGDLLMMVEGCATCIACGFSRC